MGFKCQNCGDIDHVLVDGKRTNQAVADEYPICPRCGEEVLIDKVPPVVEVLQTMVEMIGGAAFVGANSAFWPKPEPEVGDHEEQPDEEQETPSNEGGDSGGGGASGDLDDPEDQEESDDSDPDDSSDSSSDSE